MARRRFEMHHYRQALLRMRQGDSDREIAAARLMGRRKVAQVDFGTSRVVCEWWHVATVASVDAQQHMAAAFQVRNGMGHLEPAAQTTERPNPPPLAP